MLAILPTHCPLRRQPPWRPPALWRRAQSPPSQLPLPPRLHFFSPAASAAAWGRRCMGPPLFGATAAGVPHPLGLLCLHFTPRSSRSPASPPFVLLFCPTMRAHADRARLVATAALPTDRVDLGGANGARRERPPFPAAASLATPGRRQRSRQRAGRARRAPRLQARPLTPLPTHASQRGCGWARDVRALSPSPPNTAPSLPPSVAAASGEKRAAATCACGGRPRGVWPLAAANLLARAPTGGRARPPACPPSPRSARPRRQQRRRPRPGRRPAPQPHPPPRRRPLPAGGRRHRRRAMGRPRGSSPPSNGSDKRVGGRAHADRRRPTLAAGRARGNTAVWGAGTDCDRHYMSQTRAGVARWVKRYERRSQGGGGSAARQRSRGGWDDADERGLRAPRGGDDRCQVTEAAAAAPPPPRQARRHIPQRRRLGRPPPTRAPPPPPTWRQQPAPCRRPPMQNRWHRRGERRRVDGGGLGPHRRGRRGYPAGYQGRRARPRATRGSTPPPALPAHRRRSRRRPAAAAAAAAITSPHRLRRQPRLGHCQTHPPPPTFSRRGGALARARPPRPRPRHRRQTPPTAR